MCIRDSPSTTTIQAFRKLYTDECFTEFNHRGKVKRKKKEVQEDKWRLGLADWKIGPDNWNMFRLFAAAENIQQIVLMLFTLQLELDQKKIKEDVVGYSLKRRKHSLLLFSRNDVAYNFSINNRLSWWKLLNAHAPVSYTHLDVYKRQRLYFNIISLGGGDETTISPKL